MINKTGNVASNNEIASGNFSPTFNTSFSLSKEGRKTYLDQFAETIAKFRKGEVTAETARDQFLIYANFSKIFGWTERRNLIKLAVNLFTENDQSEKVCDNNLEQVDVIVQNILCETKTEAVAKLLRKALEKILNGEEVLLSTVRLLQEFQDHDVEILKELLRYIGLSGNSILFYKEIALDFKQKQVQGRGVTRKRSDDIRYLNKVFDNQKSITGKVHKLSIPEKCPAISTQYLLLKVQNPSDSDVKIELDSFVTLTEEGQQIYDLLKDEINKVPKNYFEKVKNHIESKYKNLGLTVANLVPII